MFRFHSISDFHFYSFDYFLMATEIDFPRGGAPKVLLRTTQQSYSADQNYEEEDISKLGRSGHKRRNTKPSMSDKTKVRNYISI
jgi:hypothetical protein